MSNRWQANKIGLINFWYYDEQEFSFAKGRMLLRGSNGSGKSVTMQSVIPLLLDGNLSPERLDPFGSRDRKMSSYLLEEDDSREERTGYLYLEFKRHDSETYLTVGMGIRARKGKKLDTWYFSLTDGRRVGKDFFLYKETDERVTLSKKELEYRIQSGGQIFDRQMDYMEYVNRHIFGFETVGEYKEMIDLLIQLRTPKLSKDFKPSVVNDILSDSLQPLSEDDLRPMAEAIENMDTMNMNLKMRREGKEAAEKINHVLDKYNRYILFEKASNFRRNMTDLYDAEQETKQFLQTKTDCLQRVKDLEEVRISLDAQKDAMDKERESLSKSDAFSLKNREMELAAYIAEKEGQIKEKEEQLDAKQSQYTEIEGKRKANEDAGYEKERQLAALLKEMEIDAEDMAYDEHGFFQGELKEHFDQAFDFGVYQKQLEDRRSKIEKGTAILQEAESQQRRAEEQLQKLERHQRETDLAQKNVLELEGQLIQVQNEWKEALYSWNGTNQELVLPGELLRELVRFVEAYNEDSDFAKVRQRAADFWLEKKGLLDDEIRRVQSMIGQLQESYEEQQDALIEWENLKEPEPERSEAVRKNRQRLAEMQIPYQEFYKVLEFGTDMEKADCDRLEEALLYMGILDAIVVEEQYREQVLTMDKGCCDKYLFSQESLADHSLLEVLELNDEVNNIFFNSRLTNILGNIAYNGCGNTMVSSEGLYQIGVLTGTITGEHEAGFLGTKAREQNRQIKMAACRAEMERLSVELARLKQEAAGLEDRKKLVAEEYRLLPDDEDLRISLHMMLNAQRLAEQMKKEAIQMEDSLKEMKTLLQTMRREAMEIADKLFLTCTYQVFRQADRAVRTYEQQFHQLKAGHEVYLQIAATGKNLHEQAENLDSDMEQIRYDMGRIEMTLRKEQAEYASVQEMLQLTDYKEVEARMEACVNWLNAYPAELRKCIEEKGQKEERCRQLTEQLAVNEERIRKIREQSAYLHLCFEAERNLAYVGLPEGLQRRQDDEAENTDQDEILHSAGKEAAAIVGLLAADCEKLQKDAIVEELNKVYFGNRSFLNDYQLTQTQLFEELNAHAQHGAPSAKRLDIYARYQGVKVSFHKLLIYLDEEISELQELIKEGDRELFEDILGNTVSRKIRSRIFSSNAWVSKMNSLMSAMDTSSGLRLSLRWRSRTAETEDQLDTRELVELLKKDYRLMREDEASKLALHFRSKVEEARRHARDSGGMVSFYQVMKETLDYRKWFEFQIFSQKGGEKQRELTNSVFGTFSGGEKAMSMYVPLFSAVVAKYEGGSSEAPRLISLDEAFAGVDNKNIRDMFRLMTEFQFDFIINSQVLWGDCDTLDALAIYQLLRPENAKFVSVMPYLWNGTVREMLRDEEQMEQRADALNG